MPRMNAFNIRRAKSELAQATLSAIQNYLSTTRGAALMGANAKATLADTRTIVVIAEGGTAFRITVSEFNG